MQRSKIGKGHASQFAWRCVYLDHENGGEGSQMAADASTSTTCSMTGARIASRLMQW
jgi:hypothetical protein